MDRIERQRLYTVLAILLLALAAALGWFFWNKITSLSCREDARHRNA